MTKLGRFGHHPDPAIDFCTEVDALEGMAVDVIAGLESAEALIIRVETALDFRVGGDMNAVAAKNALRQLAEKLNTRDIGLRFYTQWWHAVYPSMFTEDIQTRWTRLSGTERSAWRILEKKHRTQVIDEHNALCRANERGGWSNEEAVAHEEGKEVGRAEMLAKALKEAESVRDASAELARLGTPESRAIDARLRDGAENVCKALRALNTR